MSTIKNKSLEVKRVPLSRMLKSEMADYAQRTAQIVREYDRVNLLSKRSKEPTKKIMRGLHDTITNLFKAIEVSHLVGYPLTTEEGNIVSDFTEMINELSQLSDMYNRSIAIRVANNKRKLDRKKESEEGKENIEGTEGNEGNEPVTTAMYYVSDEETDEFADEEMAPFSTMSDPLDEDKEDAADYE